MYNNKKLLILGASEFQIPLILEAKKLGVITYVVDINIDAPAMEYADYKYQCSVKDIDKILKIAREVMPDGVTVGMVDVAIPACAQINKELNLHGIDIETAIKATNKYEMIKCFKEFNVPCPDYKYIAHDELNQTKQCNMAFPVIIKPIDMAGSRGIYLVNNNEEFLMALKSSSDISDNGSLLVEEYMIGPEVSVEMVIINGIPHVIQITDKDTSGAPHFAETGHLQPSRLSDDVKEKIKTVACNAAKSLGFTNCLGHAEIKITKDGPKMVEIGARAGGDGIGEQLILLSTGVDFSKIAIDIAFGYNVEIPSIKNDVSCIKFIQSRKGILIDVTGVEEAKKISNIYDIKFSGVIGKKYEDVVDNSGRLGYVIAYGNNYDEVIDACEAAMNMIKVVIK